MKWYPFAALLELEFKCYTLNSAVLWSQFSSEMYNVRRHSLAGLARIAHMLCVWPYEWRLLYQKTSHIQVMCRCKYLIPTNTISFFTYIQTCLCIHIYMYIQASSMQSCWNEFINTPALRSLHPFFKLASMSIIVGGVAVSLALAVLL